MTTVNKRIAENNRKLAKIWEYYRANFSIKEQKSLDRYLSPFVTDFGSHEHRVAVEYETLCKTGKIKEDTL